MHIMPMVDTPALESEKFFWNLKLLCDLAEGQATVSQQLQYLRIIKKHFDNE